MRSVLIGLVFLFAPASAHAIEPSIIHGVQTGHPALYAWANGGDVVGWARCGAGGDVCVSIAVSRLPWAGDRYAGAEPGETAPGTVFELTVQRGAETITRRTPVWEGTLAPDPPTLSGAPTVGELVTAHPGARHGGWASENVVATSIVACTAPAGGTCETLATSNGSAQATIAARLAGWYLFAQQQWGSGNNHVVYIPEQPGPRMFAEAVMGTSAPLGPVCCAPSVAAPVPSTAPQAASRPATASIRGKALRRNGRLVIGRVTCETRCAVRLKVSGGGRRAFRRSLSVKGTRELTMPARRGRLSVRVTVDGKLLASGRVRS